MLQINHCVMSDVASHIMTCQFHYVLYSIVATLLDLCYEFTFLVIFVNTTAYSTVLRTTVNSLTSAALCYMIMWIHVWAADVCMTCLCVCIHYTIHVSVFVYARLHVWHVWCKEIFFFIVHVPLCVNVCVCWGKAVYTVHTVAHK